MDATELEALATSTALALSRANQRLLDLETQLTTHVGLDWGSQGLNYPHPNMSVSTMEFGGSIGLAYEQGIYFKNTQGSPWSLQGPKIVWVPDFPLPGQTGTSNSDDYAVVAGLATGAGVASLIMKVFQNTIDNEANIVMNTNASRSEILFTWETPDAGQLSVYMQSAGAGRDWLDFTWDSGVVLRLAGRTTDISTSPVDGQIIWRSNTTKFRGYNGTAWDSFAMESWVTTAIANNTDYAKILMLAGM